MLLRIYPPSYLPIFGPFFQRQRGISTYEKGVAANLDERFDESALPRAAHLAEFAVLDVLAGLLAAVGTELIAWVLYTRAFDLEYHFKWPVWLAAPLAGGMLIGGVGYFGTRRVVNQSPLTVLRESGL